MSLLEGKHKIFIVSVDTLLIVVLVVSAAFGFCIWKLGDNQARYEERVKRLEDESMEIQEIKRDLLTKAIKK